MVVEPLFFHITLSRVAAEQKREEKAHLFFQSCGREYLGPHVPTLDPC